MKRMTPGEWRFAILLILLLIIAAIAAVSTVSSISELVLSLENDQAQSALNDYLNFEQRKLAELVQYAASLYDPGRDEVDSYLERVIRFQRVDELDLSQVAVVNEDGRCLGCKPSRDLDEGLDWASMAQTLVFRPGQIQTGFSRAGEQFMLIALAPLPQANEQQALVFVRPLNRAYLRKIQQTYPAFDGIAGVDAPPGKALRVAINDFQDQTIGYFLLHPDVTPAYRVIRIVTMVIHTLTMGFLMLAGGLGLWAVRSETQIEGMRRVASFVDAMDYLQDGLLMLDKKGRITGCNPSARTMAEQDEIKQGNVCDVFPVLSPDELDVLLDRTRPHEITKQVHHEEGTSIYRFRSQPSTDVDLILISDVTDEKMEEMRKRQIASLQLVGRIARGVAHDFNNILCAISGHASLLSLPDGTRPEDQESLQAILQESQRGASLAVHLLELSRVSRGSDQWTENLVAHVSKAAELLRVGLSNAWQVHVQAAPALPIVNLSPMQIEQMVLNLGLVAADEQEQPGMLRLAVQRPTLQPLLDVGMDFGCVILISTHESDSPEPAQPDSTVRTTTDVAGVIQSVAKTMLEEIGGRLDVLLFEGKRTYRICLPEAVAAQEQSEHVGHTPGEWQDYLAEWSVLLAAGKSTWASQLEQKLKTMGCELDRSADLVDTLSRVDEQNKYQAVVIDKSMLGVEADGLLRAIAKLQAKAGMLVICEDPQDAVENLKDDMLFLAREQDAEKLIESILKARELAGKRQSA